MHDVAAVTLHDVAIEFAASATTAIFPSDARPLHSSELFVDV